MIKLNLVTRNALKMFLTKEQYKGVDNFLTAVHSGKISEAKLNKVIDKLSRLDESEVNGVLDLLDKNLK